MTYLVTGATGGLGKAILGHLSKHVAKDNISVLVRSVEKAETLKNEGYDVRIGTYSDKESLEKAFEGIETLIFVSGVPGQEISRVEQHRNVIEAAQSAGVKNIVYTSISNGEHSKAVLAPDHIATEKLIKESGLHYKILRNNWYLENELENLKAAASGHDFLYAGGDSKVGWALRREYGEAVANAALQAFSDNIIYELSGNQISYAELVQHFKEATGANFDSISLSIEDYKAGLEESGVPDAVIEIVAGIQNDILNHQLEVEHSDLEDLLGHSQLPIVDAIKELVA